MFTRMYSPSVSRCACLKLAAQTMVHAMVCLCNVVEQTSIFIRTGICYHVTPMQVKLHPSLSIIFTHPSANSFVSNSHFFIA